MRDELKDLRDKVESSPEDIKLKKCVFGGYDCKQVDEYIKILKQNMQQSQKLFSEKYEEITSLTSVITQERDSATKKISETENKLKEASQNIANLEEDNADLKKKIDDLIEQLGDMPTTDDLQRELRERTEESCEYKKLLNESLEGRSEIISENTMLKEKVDNLSSAFERSEIHNAKLKDELTKTKVLKREIVVSTGLNIFEYQQKHNYNIERISNSITDSLNAIAAMKTAIEDLQFKTRENIDEEENSENLEA